jgi:hypothetical protein
MSMLAKFSLRDLIESMNEYESWGLLSVSLSNGTDLISSGSTPCVIIEQLPDIKIADLFVVRLFYPSMTSDDIKIEVLFAKLTRIFKDGIEHSFSGEGINSRDYFEYQAGSENKSGVQTAGNKLCYKQFIVSAPKTTLRR